MVWTEILTALALVLVIEGMLPFVSPSRYRRMVTEIMQLKDGQIRNIGRQAKVQQLIAVQFDKTVQIADYTGR